MTRRFPLRALIRALASLPLLIAAAAATPAHAQPAAVEYSQDGVHFHAIADLTGASSAATYYKYVGQSGRPAFGRAMHTVTVSAYYDSTDDDLSLLFISGGGRGDRADGRMTLTGLPSAAQLALSDDAGEFRLRGRTGRAAHLTGDFSFHDSTDGFVLSNLGAASFTAKMKLDGTGSTAMRLTDGDPTAGGDFLPLKLDKPLWIRVTTVGGGKPTGNGVGGGPPIVGGGTPVPEPSALAVTGLVAATGLLRRRRRRRRARPTAAL